MKTVLIIHGIGGHAGIHWQQWLSDELMKRDCTVLMPDLPNSDRPDRKEWLAEIKKIIADVDQGELIIIAHSLGVTSALDFLEQTEAKINGLISVSGFAEPYGAELNNYFLSEKHIDFQKIKAHVNWAAVLYGDDDPYVTQQALRYVADALSVEPIVVPGGGHLNTEAGYTTLPQLLEILKKHL